MDVEGEGSDDDVEFERTTLQILIGLQFVHHAHKLITPPNGERKVPLVELLNEQVSRAKSLEMGELFDNEEVARHTYYMVGFMCQAGAKEAKRRTANNDVGACIGAIDRHFVKASEESDVEAVKAQLPEGLTEMVDRRNGMGGLTYPRPLAYRVFGLVEYVYSHLAVVKNLNVYGGTLLSKIRSELCASKDVVELFSNFFDEDEFPPETIQTALEYYVKVFSNLRARRIFATDSTRTLRKSRRWGCVSKYAARRRPGRGRARRRSGGRRRPRKSTSRPTRRMCRFVTQKTS